MSDRIARLLWILLAAMACSVACGGVNLASTGCRPGPAPWASTLQGSIVYLSEEDGVPYEAPLGNLEAAVSLPVPSALHAASGRLAAVAVAPGTRYIAGEYVVPHKRNPHTHRLAVWGGRLPQPIVLWRGGGFEGISWSPSGRTLYFSVSGRPGRLMAAAITGSASAHVRALRGGIGLTLPVASPDGTEIAAHTSVGPSPVVRLRVAHGRLTKLGSLPGFVAWSPDGRGFIAVNFSGGFDISTPPQVRHIAPFGDEPLWLTPNDIVFVGPEPRKHPIPADVKDGMTDDPYPPPPSDLCTIHLTGGTPSLPVSLVRLPHSGVSDLAYLPPGS